MARKQVLVAGYALATLGLTAGFNNCGKSVSFQRGTQFYDGFSYEPDGTRAYQTSRPMTDEQIKPLDVVWVIDNSGSMNEEAANVRTNFQAFVRDIAAVKDVKLALINKTGTDKTFVDLPTTPFPSLNMNHKVNSNDPLQVLASALCPANPAAGTVCASAAVTAHTDKFPEATGKLNGFLRPDSRKVVVMVTDDESSLKAPLFKSIFDSLYASEDLVVYAWVGLGTTSPCQARTGTQYLSLTKATGGEVNNICDVDWSDKFKALANNVVTLAYDTIPLPQEVLVGKISKVILNGTELNEVEYKLSGTGIVLAAAVRKDLKVAEIRIEFR